MGVFVYFDEDTNVTVYHVIPDSESEYAPSSFLSEADSSSSGTTILSDELPGYFVLHHGRQQAASENVVRWMPPDNIRRHILQYLVHTYVFRGHYRGPVKDILAPIPGKTHRVLELGTRSGTWIQAMAEEFPHVQFHSLDMVPVVPHVPRPNVVFEVYDFTEGLLLESGSQDIVFLNSLFQIVKDYRGLLREVYRVLRPGGLIHISDFSMRGWDVKDPNIPSTLTNSSVLRHFGMIRQRLASIGADPDTCEKLPQWLSPSSDHWGKDQRGFRDLQSDVCLVPFYPHDGSPCVGTIDPSLVPYLRHLVDLSVRDTYGMMKDAGLTHEEAENLIECAVEESHHHENCVTMKMYMIHAIKS